jgi:hypothetical protein
MGWSVHVGISAASIIFTIEQSATSTPGSVARRRSRSMCWRLKGSAWNGTIPTWPTAIRSTSSRARVVSPPVHELLPVAETGQRDTFLEHLRRQEQHETTCLEMSRALAQSGIEKWTVDTGKMTMTFYDKADREMLVEHIK